MSNWISVKERMPDMYVSVLWWNKYKRGCVEADTYCIAAYGAEGISGCTHWMPLPGPPAKDDFIGFSDPLERKKDNLKPNAKQNILAAMKED